MRIIIVLSVMSAALSQGTTPASDQEAEAQCPGGREVNEERVIFTVATTGDGDGITVGAGGTFIIVGGIATLVGATLNDPCDGASLCFSPGPFVMFGGLVFLGLGALLLIPAIIIDIVADRQRDRLEHRYRPHVTVNLQAGPSQLGIQLSGAF